MDHTHQKTVIAVAGPTAVGKTAIAIELARHFNTAIISADSRQCFREMNIGVARPSRSDLAAAPHYFIATHSIHQDVTAAIFEDYALLTSERLFHEHDTVILAGGTGLYLNAFCEGLDTIPTIPEPIRNGIRDNYEKEGMQWLRSELDKKDPLFSREGEMQNPQRMMRALEVVETTGKSIITFQRGSTKERPFRVIRIGLELPRPLLNQRIDARVEQMMRDGLLEEVRGLQGVRHLNALRTVGYNELFAYFDGTVTLDRAIDLIKTHTRQYAKRQMTWFRRDAGIRWFSSDDHEGIIRYAATPD